jgi:hypothetical protein
VSLWLLEERLSPDENGFMLSEGKQCDTAMQRLPCFKRVERAVIELRLGVAGQLSARLLLDRLLDAPVTCTVSRCMLPLHRRVTRPARQHYVSNKRDV